MWLTLATWTCLHNLPFWGGPTGIDTDGTKAGDRVWTYGNSSLRCAAVAAHRHQPG